MDGPIVHRANTAATESERAIALDMLVEPDAGAGRGHDRCERGLTVLRHVHQKTFRSSSDSEPPTAAYSSITFHRI
jgi:hypothetical protein